MKIKSITLMCIACILLSCNGQELTKDNYKIKRLEKAENGNNIKAIEDIFDFEAVLYTTELMPIKGKKAIVSIYDFVFSRKDVVNVEYKVNSTEIIDNHYHEYGKLTTKKVNQNKTTQPFNVIFEKQGNSFRILEISFGEENLLKKELPQMLKPTGDYNIGEQTFFFDKNQSGNGRLLSFQIWYPTNSDTVDMQPFRIEQVITNASAFIGYPFFASSYFSEIKSHTMSEAPPVPGKTFPVLIYNHGYGGYTQVYQTVFEDLVSHGYIVVSIGHENESALLIKGNGEVLGNSPDNDFYSRRAAELNGEEIGMYQSIILNSDIDEENMEAYKKMLQLTPLHNESTNLWASDTKTAIKKLRLINGDVEEKLFGIFDLDRIGIFGHSLGGATAGQMCYGNTGIKAGINLDGFQFGDLYFNKLEVPFMFVSSNQEGNRFLRALAFSKNAEQDFYQVVIKGFTHDSFTDLKYITEGDKNAMELQRALVKSFFDKYLKGESMKLKGLEDKFERISISRLTQQK